MTRQEAIKWFEGEKEAAERQVVAFESCFKCFKSAHRKIVAYNEMAISALREQPRWISVTERLPGNEDVVLCVTKNKRPFVCRYDHYWKHWRVSGSVKVTHWMPLPEPPKEEV